MTETKPLNKRRVEVIQIRLTPSEKAMIRMVAKNTGMTISDFVRQAILGKKENER